MDQDNAPSLAQLTLGDLEHELGTTRNVLERIPGDRLDWRPHEKSWTILELGTHISGLVEWMVGMLETQEYDMAASPDAEDPPESVDALLDAFDATTARLRQTLEDTSEEALSAPWTLRDGEHEIFTLPRFAAIRSAGISHMIHHRGQLALYLRLLDEPVPGIYGPSADESG